MDSELKSERKGRKKNSDELQSKVNQAELRLRATELDLEQTTRELQTQKASNSELKTTIQGLEDAAIDKDFANVSLDKDLQALENGKLSLQNLLTEKEKELKDLDRQVGRMDAWLAAAEEKLDHSKKGEVATVREETVALRQRLDLAEELADDLRQQVQAKQEDAWRDALDEILASFDSLSQELPAKVAEHLTSDELDRLKEDHEELKRTKTLAIKETQRFQESFKTCRGQSESDKKTIEAQKTEINNLKNSVRNLEAVNADVQATRESCRADRRPSDLPRSFSQSSSLENLFDVEDSAPRLRRTSAQGFSPQPAKASKRARSNRPTDNELLAQDEQEDSDNDRPRLNQKRPATRDTSPSPPPSISSGPPTLTASENGSFVISVANARALLCTSDVIPEDVPALIRNQFTEWNKKEKVDWTCHIDAETRRCVRNRHVAKQKCEWTQGEDHACSHCHKGGHVCVIAEQDESIRLFPGQVTDDVSYEVSDSKYWVPKMRKGKP